MLALTHVPTEQRQTLLVKLISSIPAILSYSVFGRVVKSKLVDMVAYADNRDTACARNRSQAVDSVLR